MRTMILYIATLLFFASCTTIEKLVDKGEYDAAFAVAVNKLQGKKNKKTKHVQGLEEAFQRLNERDLAYASRLITQKRASNWAELHSIYTTIEDRQSLINPMIPLTSKDGYRANFTFVRTSQLIDEAAINAAEYDYKIASDLLEQGRQGDKESAKSAYYVLGGINTFVTNYKDVYNLQDEAEYYGQTRVSVVIKNRAQVILPSNFERRVLSINTNDLNDKWTKYYLGGSSQEEIDIRTELVIKNLDVSPEREIVTIHTNEKKIKDGFEYVLDKKGNVKKDSLGNDIKKDKFRKVKAVVTEIRRSKSVIITGQVYFKDLVTGERFKSERVNVVANFDDVACSYTGDKRAINRKWSPHLNSNLRPFPSDFAITMDAAENLKSELKNKIKQII